WELLWTEGDFLAGHLVLAHWVSREGLSLAAEAPWGRVELAHYGQRPAAPARWLAALGEPGRPDDGGWAGPVRLAGPGAPPRGLHGVRFADRRAAGAIAEAGGGPPAAELGPEGRVRQRRPAFTLKRPVVGLSFVDDRPGWAYRGQAEADPALESGWALPLLRS